MSFQIAIISVLLAEAFGSLTIGGILVLAGPITSLWAGCIFVVVGLAMAVVLQNAAYEKNSTARKTGTEPNLERAEVSRTLFRRDLRIHYYFTALSNAK